MNSTTATLSDEAIHHLVLIANDLRDECATPKAREIARARMDASTTMANLLGHGMTPTHLMLTALQARDAAGPYPHATAHNTARKVWADAVVRFFRTFLEA